MKRGAHTLLGLCLLVPYAAADETSLEDFINRARDADVVVLGEIHDNPEHHRRQAQIVAALEPAALVFEMIQQADESEVNTLRTEGADRAALAGAMDWDASGWPDFDLYAPILEAAPDARIFGAGQPREQVARAVEEGAAAGFGPDAPKYRLDEALPGAEQAAREAAMATAHCDKLPEEMLRGMVEAQRFRDAGLADAALWARTITGSDEQVVVIAGSGHADRRRGAPALIALAAPEVEVLSLGQLEAPPGQPDAFDAWMLAPPPERDDPCAALSPPGR